MFEKITFEYNGLDFADDLRVNEIKGRGLTPSDVSTIEVPGMTGVHATRKTRQPRYIEIKFTIVGTSLTDLRNKINLMSERLDLDEVAPLVFSDEPDKTYYAIMVDATDDDEIKNYGMGTFVFFCPDPYKYGPEQTATLNTETGSIVNVAGTAPTTPIFDLTTSSLSTYAIVSNQFDEYSMLGEVLDFDDSPYEKYARIFEHNMQNVTNWTPANAGETDEFDTGTVAREFIDGKNYFVPTSYGTPSAGLYGPTLKRSLPKPLQDFRVEADVQFYNASNKAMVGDLAMYVLDVNGKILARFSLRDTQSGSARVIALSRIGGYGDPNRKQIINEYGDKVTTWNSFDGVIRLEREGTKWTAYLGKYREDGTHHSRMTRYQWDTKEKHLTAATQVVFAFSKRSETPAPIMRVGAVRVDEINAEAGVPYIVREGDTLTFDHGDREEGYRINGEPVTRLKNFGATQFKLRPGENVLALEPGGTFTGTVRWRDAYK